MVSFESYINEDYTEVQHHSDNVPSTTAQATVFNRGYMFAKGDCVTCPGGVQGVVNMIVMDANTKSIKYLVQLETGDVGTYPECNLTRVSSQVGPKDNIAPVGTNGYGMKVESTKENTMKSFDEYCAEETEEVTEAISDKDEKKIEKAGLEVAKKIFKADMDEDKAKKLIADVIKKNKDKEPDEVASIVINSFRAGAH